MSDIKYGKIKKILSIVILLFVLKPAFASDKKIVDYIVIREHYRLDDLIKQVKSFICSGWQPFGPMIVSFQSPYYQVMVKYEDG